MIRILPILLMFPLFPGALKAQVKEYKLVSTDSLSDFNYSAIKFIDTTGDRMNIFYPVKGRFTVYTFIATFKGLSYRYEKEIDFHDIVIIKTNKQNKIVDAYQYTLEWAEMPLSYDLYKSSAKGQQLTNHFSIGKLQLRRVNYYRKEDREFKEPGILLL